jgi:hypothetical protein
MFDSEIQKAELHIRPIIEALCLDFDHISDKESRAQSTNESRGNAGPIRRC